MIYVWIAAALLVAGFGGFGAWKYTSAIEGRAAAEKERDEWKASSESWERFGMQADKDFKDNERLAKERDREKRQAEQRAAVAEGKLGELLLRDVSSRSWAVAPVPDAVRRLRRETFGCPTDLTVPCAGFEPAPDAGTADARRDERGARKGS